MSSSADYPQLAVVAFITLLAVAANYSYNSLKDAKEDADNPLHPKPFRFGQTRFTRYLPHALFSLALAISCLFTNIWSFALLFAFILYGVIYSLFKLKRVLFVKTSTVSLAYVLLLGSCYLAFSPVISLEAAYAGFLLFFLMFAYSVISDMRDIGADCKHNHITIPVRFGYARSWALVSLLFFALNLLTAASLFYGVLSAKQAVVFALFAPMQLLLIERLFSKKLTHVDILKDSSFAISTAYMLFLF